MFCVVHTSYDISKFYNHTKQHPVSFLNVSLPKGAKHLLQLLNDRNIGEELSKTHPKFTN